MKTFLDHFVMDSRPGPHHATVKSVMLCSITYWLPTAHVAESDATLLCSHVVRLKIDNVDAFFNKESTMMPQCLKLPVVLS